jgi:hypothetical protein
MDTDMDIDKELTIDDLIKDLNKISFFSKEEEYSILSQSVLIELEDIEDEEQFNNILEDTRNRYKRYLKDIIFTNETKNVKSLIKHFIESFDDYDINNETLFNLMQRIDLSILDLIHSSKEPRFWLN